MNSLDNLEKNLNYIFTNKRLLEIALTHKSSANESGGESYERFEFLGDAIIEFIVSDYIVKYKELGAGELSKLRAKLVSTNYLFDIATKLQLNKYVIKSKSLPSLSKKNTADLFESLIGAIYLDGGLDSAKKVIYDYIIINDSNISNVIKNSQDYKTLFQEYMQSKNLSFDYRLISSKGKDHDKSFTVKLLTDKEDIVCDGKSIQEAEEKCAKQYLANIKIFNKIIDN